MVEPVRFPVSLDSPHLVYGEDVFPEWYAARRAVWERSLGFEPDRKLIDSFDQQSGAAFWQYFEATYGSSNEKTQRAWAAHLGDRWELLVKSVGHEPQLTADQHTEWRRAQEASFDGARAEYARKVVEAGSSFASILRTSGALPVAASAVENLSAAWAGNGTSFSSKLAIDGVGEVVAANVERKRVAKKAKSEAKARQAAELAKQREIERRERAASAASREDARQREKRDYVLNQQYKEAKRKNGLR
ncbi:hypothetical protein [Agromyces sp. Root81]|uniref:hypothetical protein n=1 Tax=Agromyces sp. Root81 TaxID=1736601 RepID=UPI000AAD31A5|nr:hypothetical protein [Agromyces sp. Root81]